MSMLLPENAVSIIRGTSKTLNLTVRDRDGNAVNLTDTIIYFTVKKTEKDQHALIQKISTDATQIEIPNPTDGTAKIYISPEDTVSICPARYKFDVLVILSSGERYVVVDPSIFEIKAGITVVPQ